MRAQQIYGSENEIGRKNFQSALSIWQHSMQRVWNGFLVFFYFVLLLLLLLFQHVLLCFLFFFTEADFIRYRVLGVVLLYSCSQIHSLFIEFGAVLCFM